jgi:hypothetical protein
VKSAPVTAAERAVYGRRITSKSGLDGAPDLHVIAGVDEVDVARRAGELSRRTAAVLAADAAQT